MLSERGNNNQDNGNVNNSNNCDYLLPGTDVLTITIVDCYNCGKQVHMSFNWNELDRIRNINVNLFQGGNVFAKHNEKYVVCKTRIRIGTFSTDIRSKNSGLVMNVQTCNEDNVL